MATNGNQFNPDDINNQGQNGQGQQGAPASQPVNISGSEAQDASSNAPTQQGQANPKATSSGRFQNLNSYLKANQGFNQEGGGLAGQINQNLTSKANDLQKNFAQAKDDYQKSLENARQRYDGQFVTNTLQNANSVSQDDQNKFAQMRDATYKGPTQLSPDLQTQAQDFSNLTSNVGNEQGRFNLLQQLYNKPSYSSGQQTLDNLFLQADPNQLANLQNSKTISNQLNNSLGQTQADAAGQAVNATEEANQTRNQTRNALTGAITGFEGNMDTSVQQALADRAAKYQQEQELLSQNKISSDDAMKLFNSPSSSLYNLGDASTMSIYNLDPSKYVTQNTVDPTRQSVASSDDYNRINALKNLAGGTLNDQTSKIVDEYGNPALAGTYQKESPYNFDNARFMNDLNTVKSQYETARNPQQAAYDAAQASIGSQTAQVNAAADPIRQQKIQEYNTNKTLGLPNTMPDPTNMSSLDILNNYGEQKQSNNGSVIGSYNPYSDLIASLSKNQQSAYNSKQMLDQLASRYGTDRKLNVTDAAKYAPVQIANSGPNVDTANPQGDVANNQTLMAPLKKIYNR